MAEKTSSQRSSDLNAANNQNCGSLFPESDAAFRAIAESSPDAFVLSSADMKIVFWNRAAEQMFGYSQKEVLGKSNAVLMSSESLQSELAARDRFITQGAWKKTTQPLEVMAVKSDGTLFPIEVSHTNWRHDGQSYYCAIIRDCTARRQAEQQLRSREERFRMLAESLTDAMYITQKNGEIIYWNRAAEEFYGYSRNEITGKKSYILMPERFKAVHRDYKKTKMAVNKLFETSSVRLNFEKNLQLFNLTSQ